MNTHRSLHQKVSLRAWRSFRVVAALTCAGLIHLRSAAADASPAAAAANAQTGVVEGRVYNAASGTYVTNARVTVPGTSLQAFTSESGDYQLRGVPAGTATIRVTFSGQTDLTETVSVAPGTAATANFTFNATGSQGAAMTVLNKFVVEESRFRNAQEIATNEERVATNIKSVVALDSLGYIADGNVGEFVKFLPGVDVSFGGTNSNPDNATAVGVRGFGPESTAILIDGMPIASGAASSLTRAVQLDGLSINNASRLEIIKVATPDMPQDSPGGAINLITRGAFELARPTYDLSIAFNGNSNTFSDTFRKTPGLYEPNYKTLPSIRFNAAIPLTPTFGISFNVSTDNKYTLTRSSSMRDWFYTARNVTINGVATPVANAQGGIGIHNPVIDRFELRDQQWMDHRHSGGVRLDWRPIPGLEVRASGQLSVVDSSNVQRRTQWRYSGNGIGIDDWGADFVQGHQRTATFNPNVSGSMTVDARDKEGFTSQGTLTAKYNRGPWSINAAVMASESYNSYPDRKNGHFSTVDATINPGRMDLLGIDDGVVGEIKLWDAAGNPLDYGRLSAWNQFTTTSGTARSSEVNSRSLRKQYNFDVARDLDFLPDWIRVTGKTGFMSKEEDERKWGAGATYRMHYVGPPVPNSELESEFATETKYGYATPQYWADPGKIYQLYLANPANFDDQLFSPSLNVDNRAWNYASRVGTAKGLSITNSEWYGMATANLFRNRLTIIGGARQSRKDTIGYNVFNDPQYQYVKMPDGTLYRDSVYTNGLKYDGSNNNYPAGDPRRDRMAVMTDLALRARMAAAGVKHLPSQLELAPNGTGNGTRENNFHFAPLGRYTRFIDSGLTQPWTPQIQVAYEIRDDLRLQVAWSKETRLPDLESAQGVILGGADFQINEAAEPTDTLGGDGSIRIANVKGQPEINQSYNAKLSYYPKNGGGRYSISYYYKVVDQSWQTFSSFNTDSDYDSLLASMGTDRDSYPNYRIDTILPTGERAIRKGFEIEAVQNLGIFGDWGRGIDVFLTYTRRPVVATTGGETRLGWIPMVPVRAKWTGGLSYSMRRFSIQSRFTYTEKGITYSGGGTTVTLPDGTNGSVQLYNLNDIPPELNLQANYVLNRRMTLFSTFDRVLSGKTYGRISDARSGLMPEYASWRTLEDRGVKWTAGINTSF